MSKKIIKKSLAEAADKIDTELAEAQGMPNDEDWEIIKELIRADNKTGIEQMRREDFYVFPVRLSDNIIDRVFDKMSDEFLSELTDSCIGLSGIRDHEWQSGNQFARIYKAEFISNGDEHYVKGMAYTLTSEYDTVNKIKAGLLRETSIGFESENDTCSICGAVTTKTDESQIAVCPNGHKMGETYDGKICYNSINKLKDLYEWSLVAVPCQKGAGIISKKLTIKKGAKMKLVDLKRLRLFSSKAFKELNDDIKSEISDVMDGGDDSEITEEEINKIIEENESLKAQVKELSDTIEEMKSSCTKETINREVEKAIDGLNPLTEVVKENMLRDIDLDSMELDEDGTIKEFDSKIDAIKTRYKGLYKEVSEEPEPEEKEDAPDNVKTKSMKSVVNSGINFNVSSTSKSAQANTKVTSGIQF